MKIKNGFEINIKLLSSFEEKFDIALPKDYIDFMLKNNGGEPDKDYIFDFYDNVIEKNNTSLVRSFFRIYETKSKSPVYDDLEEICEIMWAEETLSKKTLPIADDPGGNIICLSLDKYDYGAIYFANHEFEDTETGYLFMSKISSNFTEFVNKMYLNVE